MPRDSVEPSHGRTLSVNDFLTLWITQLQVEITHQETDADDPKFMVRGYDESNPIPGRESDFTEIDIYNDDPTNLTDGAWSDPQIWREGETIDSVVVGGELPERKPSSLLLCDPADSAMRIREAGGTITRFDVDGEDHYEVSIGDLIYGPMIDTELYWFSHGLQREKETRYKWEDTDEPEN